MKKSLAVLLTVLLLLSSMPLALAEGGHDIVLEGPHFVVSKTEGKQGELVNVPVFAVNNPGIVSAKVRVYFDTAVLEIVDYAAGEFSDGGYSWSDITRAQEKGYFVINWCDAALPDSTAELLATLTFRVKEHAAYGSSTLTIEFSCEDDVYNYDWDTVDFAPYHGEVYVLYPVDAVALNADTLDLYNGDSSALTAAVSSEGKTDERVSWTSSNPEIAIVDENGVVTAVGLGTAYVTATAVYGGLQAVCAVNVTCGHRNTTATEALDATCTKPGHNAYVTCNDCCVFLVDKVIIPALGHSYDSVVTAPDCENGGYTTYTCVCGDSYVADHTAALGHASEVIKGYAATCTATGLTDGAKCSVCGKILTAQETIPALGHSYDSVVTAPDCENGGYTTYTCACGDSYVADHTAALGHAPEVIKGYAATCTATGLTDSAKCSICGKILTAQETIPALGHSYDSVVTAPDCENGGYTTYTCACGDSYVDTVVPATGEHVYDDNRDADCNVCGHVRPIVILGDVNGDGKINNRDLGIMQLYLNDSDLAGKTFNEQAADLDGNGRINNRDLGKLQQLLNNG